LGHRQALTSADIKAKVFQPPLNMPTPIEIINIKPESVRIDESRAISRKCDQPGVVGEKESCK
jgi:hypothetical protein